MPTDDRLLARQLLSLLPLVMRTMAADMRRQGCALPPTHFALPAMLARRPRTMGELAERMGVSAPTMSNLIATLAERGWVTRRQDPDDRRVTFIELTAFGQRSLQRHQVRAEQRVARLLAALPPAKRRDLLSGLTALREVVETSFPRSESQAPLAAPPAVPRMVRNIIDAVSSGVIAQSALSNLARVPAAILPIALPKILAALGLPAGWTLDQLMAEMTQRNADAPSALLTAALSIVGFAALRGVFSFLQVYWAERNSQNVAFELRNDLFAKIQRLSFSYHDRNQTGQLMIRATDDVEKVRIFIGQGVVQLVSAVVLIVGTLLILFTTNLRLAFVTLPILPIAMVMFVIFAGLSQPLFSRVQARLSALNTTLQENLAGIRVVKAFAREREEQAKFQGQAG